MIREYINTVFILFFLLLFVYNFNLITDFGINDDYYVYWPTDSVFRHPQMFSALMDGRPIDVIFKTFHYFSGSINLQWIYRFISVLMSAVIGAIFYRFFIIKLNFAGFYAICLTISFLTLPGFQVFALWAITYVCVAAALLGVISSVLLDDVIDKYLRGDTSRLDGFVNRKLFVAVFLLFLGLLSYQPTAFAFIILPLCSLLFRHEKVRYHREVRISLHLLVVGIAIGLYALYLIGYSEILSMISPRATQYPLSVSLDIASKIGRVILLAQTALTWQSSGSLVQTFFALYAIVVSLGLFFISRSYHEQKRGSFPSAIMIAALDVLAVVLCTFILANLVNLAGDGYATYSRHTLIFTMCFLIILCCGGHIFYSAIRRMIPAKVLKILTTSLILGFSVVSIFGAFSAANQAVGLQNEDWLRTQKVVDALGSKITNQDVYVAVVLGNRPGGNREIMGSTSTFRTHAFLILHAALAEKGFLIDGFRDAGVLKSNVVQELLENMGSRESISATTDGIPRTRAVDGGLETRFATRFGTFVFARYIESEAQLIPGVEYDFMLDYRR